MRVPTHQMILLGYIIWIVLAIIVGRRIARARRARGIGSPPGWSLAILLALLPLWDVILGLPVTTLACVNRAGLQVHEEVSLPLSSVVLTSDIHHFPACSQCWQILGRGFANEAQVRIDLQSYPVDKLEPASLVSGPGPTRYWISRRGDPYCEAFYTHLVTKERDSREFWETWGPRRDEDACIAAESIPEITAEYRLATRRFVDRRFVFPLNVHEAELNRSSDGTKLASLARLFQLTMIGSLSGVQDFALWTCPSNFSKQPLGNSFSHAELLKRLDATAGGAGASP